MNAGATVAMIVAARQKQLIRRLREAGALSPDRAISIEELDGGRSAVLRGLIDRGVVVEVPGDRCHLDPQAADALDAHRQKVLLIMLAMFGLAILVYFLMR